MDIMQLRIPKMVRWCAASAALLAGAAVLAPAPAEAQAAAGAKSGGQPFFDLNVEVVNDPDHPVPVNGTVTVGNLPATQTVEVAGTPTVNVASLPPIAVASSEQPFQLSIRVILEAGDPEFKACHQFVATDLPVGTLMVVDQVVAQTFLDTNPFERFTFEATVPTIVDGEPNQDFTYVRLLPLADLDASQLVAVEEQLVVGPEHALGFRVCVLDETLDGTIAFFRVNGHLVPAVPPGS